MIVFNFIHLIGCSELLKRYMEMTVELNKMKMQSLKMQSLEDRLAEKSKKMKAVEAQREYFKNKVKELKSDADVVNVLIISLQNITTF